MGRQGPERRGVGDFPAEEADSFAAIGMDHDALLAVIHAERERGARLIHALQAEQTGAIAGPVVQSFSANADITQRLRSHSARHHAPRRGAFTPAGAAAPIMYAQSDFTAVFFMICSMRAGAERRRVRARLRRRARPGSIAARGSATSVFARRFARRAPSDGIDPPIG